MEKLRQIIRNRLGYDSTLYSLLSRALNFAAIARREGVGTALRLSRLGKQAPGAVAQLRFTKLRHPIFARAGTPDITTLVNNAVREEYGAYEPAAPPAFMIDAGAYIGDSSAYFASKFPALKIIALEPHPANHALASQNLAPYGTQVTLLNKALASTPGTVMISGEHDSAVVGQSGRAVDAVTVPMIMALAGVDSIDILKMDIEGAEADVLDASADQWLGKTGLLIVELHNAEIEASVMATLVRNGFQAKRHRSLWYCRARL